MIKGPTRLQNHVQGSFTLQKRKINCRLKKSKQCLIILKTSLLKSFKNLSTFLFNFSILSFLNRDINEKYVFSFAKKVHEKISENYINNQCLNHNLFDRIQYDILRRLRSYWVPRFILSKLKAKGKDYGSFPLPPLTPDYSRQSTYMTASSMGKVLEKFHKDFRVGSAGHDRKAYVFSYEKIFLRYTFYS
jgi:hypothetical protein